MNNEKKYIDGGKKKNDWLKFKILIVMVVLIVGLISCGCTKSEDSVDNKFKKDVVRDNMDDEINNMKISTPEQCKEKGLHYIGKMNVPRIFHKAIKLKDGNILIVGGNNSITYRNNSDMDGKYSDDIEYIPEYSIELFNPINNTFKKLKAKTSISDISEIILLDNDNVLLVSDKEYQVFDTKKNKFYAQQFKNMEFKYVSYAEKLRDNLLLECYGNIHHGTLEQKFNQHFCCITDITNFKLKVSNNINIEIPEYIKPTNFGYLKINQNEILIYTKSYPRTNTKDIYLALYDIKNNKIIKSNILEHVGNYREAKPILLKNNKILFTGGVIYERGVYISYNVLPWFIYNIEDNKIEKTIDMLFNDSITAQNPIKLLNGNILIVEDNKIRQLFNTKTNKFEDFNGFNLENIMNPNILQIGDNQLLITGGENKRNNNISNDAFLYTF